MIKGELMLRAINEHSMDRAIIFCRTKLDCDNAEAYLQLHGGGEIRKNNPVSYHLVIQFI